jgi:hypothetical protein
LGVERWVAKAYGIKIKGVIKNVLGIEQEHREQIENVMSTHLKHD